MKPLLCSKLSIFSSIAQKKTKGADTKKSKFPRKNPETFDLFCICYLQQLKYMFTENKHQSNIYTSYSFPLLLYLLPANIYEIKHVWLWICIIFKPNENILKLFMFAISLIVCLFGIDVSQFSCKYYIFLVHLICSKCIK